MYSGYGHRTSDAPNQSDTTILMTVEDLICIALGPPQNNKVNFRTLKDVMYIFARQLRMLEQQVEMRIAEPTLGPRASAESYEVDTVSRTSKTSKASRRSLKKYPEKVSAQGKIVSPSISEETIEETVRVAKKGEEPETERQKRHRITHDRDDRRRQPGRERTESRMRSFKDDRDRSRFEQAQSQKKEQVPRERGQKYVDEIESEEEVDVDESVAGDKKRRKKSRKRGVEDKISYQDAETEVTDKEKAKKKEKDEAESSSESFRSETRSELSRKEKRRGEKAHRKDRDTARTPKTLTDTTEISLDISSDEISEDSRKEKQKKAAKKERDKTKKDSADNERKEKGGEKGGILRASESLSSDFDKDDRSIKDKKIRKEKEQDKKDIEKQDADRKVEKRGEGRDIGVERKKGESKTEKSKRKEGKIKSETGHEGRYKDEEFEGRDASRELEDQDEDREDIKRRKKSRKDTTTTSKKEGKGYEDNEETDEDMEIPRKSGKVRDERARSERDSERDRGTSKEDRTKTSKKRDKLDIMTSSATEEKSDKKGRKRRESEESDEDDEYAKSLDKDKRRSKKEMARKVTDDGTEIYKESYSSSSESVDRRSIRSKSKSTKERGERDLEIDKEKLERVREKLKTDKGEKMEKDMLKEDRYRSEEEQEEGKEDDDIYDRGRGKSKKGKETSQKVKGRLEEGDILSERGSPEREGETWEEKERSRVKPKTDKIRSQIDEATRKGKGPRTSVAITEEARGKDKTLVLEDMPKERAIAATERVLPSQGGSIKVVTLSQFNLLEAAVKALQDKAVVPLPTLPADKKLLEDIAKGNASLADAMDALKIGSRVSAAEKAIENLVEMITQLAARGSLPQEFIDASTGLKETVQSIAKEAAAAAQQGAKKSNLSSITSVVKRSDSPKTGQSYIPMSDQSVRIPVQQPDETDQETPAASAVSRGKTTAPTLSMPSAEPRVSFAAISKVSHISSQHALSLGILEDAINAFRNDLYGALNEVKKRITTNADSAMAYVRSVGLKMDEILKLDHRITTLNNIIHDYAQQLNGLDAGLAIQTQSFQEQIAVIHTDLKDGLEKASTFKNQTQVDAIAEVNGKCMAVVSEMEEMNLEHQALELEQQTLDNELKRLTGYVEMLREEKADREEVLDGLNDKADISRLEGLVNEKDLEMAHNDLLYRIALCHQKFDKQDQAWMRVQEDLTQLAMTKAEYVLLERLRDDTQMQIRELHERLKLLARCLADPTAAVTTRQLAKDTTCGACRIPAMMPYKDSGAPPALPVLRAPPQPGERLPPAGAEEDICLTEVNFKEDKVHACHRWVGGSHTAVSERVRTSVPHPAPAPHCIRRYLRAGTDGKMYKMEDVLQPCIECNPVTPPEKIPGEAEQPIPCPIGAGDQVNMITDGAARRVTIIGDELIVGIPTVEGEGDGSKASSSIDIKRHSDKVTGSRSSLDKSTLSLRGKEGSVKSETRSILSMGKAAMVHLARAEGGEDVPISPMELGHIIKGHSTVVSESAALRAAIKYETALSRIDETGEEDVKPEPLEHIKEEVLDDDVEEDGIYD